MPETNAAWRRENIGHLLFAASDRCIRDKLGVLHRAGFGTISDAQLALFHNLDIGGTRLTTIAARAGLTKQSMVELVDKAAVLGFVERTPDPEDRRAKIVLFTAAGRAVLATLEEAVAVAERGVADVVGARFLAEMKHALGAYSAPPPIEAQPTDARADPAWRSGNVGRVFALAARRFVHDVLSAVHRRGHREVGDVLLALFRNLDLSGTRLTELSARAHVTKQSMRELVDRAEGLGFVQRRPDPLDKRAKTIMFTDAGLALLDEMRIGIVAAEERFGQATSDAFRAELKTRLTDYCAAAETHRTPT